MPASRRCPKCHRLITAGRRYCPIHQAEYEAKRGTTTARGYGSDHQRERERIQQRIDAGESVHCWSCGVRLQGRAWHLDHNDDRNGYRGPRCVTCNTSDGGKKAHK